MTETQSFSVSLSGVEVKSVSVMEGDPVTLNTDLTDVQEDLQILWLVGPKEIRIADIRRQKPNTYIETGRYGDKLKLDSQTGSLTITNIRITDTGLYKLEIINSRETSENKFNVTVYARLPVPVIIRNSSQCSSSSERSSVSKCVLLCSVMNVTHVSLSWYKGNSLLSNISESDLNIRLSLPLEVEYHDTNTYRCVVSNPVSNQTQHLDINELCQACSDPSQHYLIPLITVIVVGLLVIVFVIFWHNCKQQIMRDVEALQTAYS
ncbi:natural killer cell receptor 2B4-like isoform X2 [Triplophysa dalaica]|uniref:natural killer cell receptor 2B4-like isoform X3 n=1 Tax=Triplophysa dalaica TaxID=1582913 RepID=UPI0024DFDE2E|nr:natural killer cell receptor 2B4-like isoform X3 [Triplophysa dalaica]XP_056615186.1 natural killer cell receptor 2B4-like isoform X2 [Triplophysa dalaica]